MLFVQADKRNRLVIFIYRQINFLNRFKSTLFRILIMAGHEGDPAEIAKLTGLSKYFNSITTRGRVNIVAATYGSIAVGYLLYKMGGSKDAKPPKSS
ncbi:ATP synthase membrane subunit K, mitochondrial-like [Daktulosphaira vitifoliae]|uniref:ATP synthase membrane subunit K, mitochondrial-like n=1 Tax=Daktulosphaira vitifoliae TaxID=58002 RepID=UPI0021A9C9EC|nr:ATP synthase membrane subunit K, mitochondrial-like [Daktulosphaira vitifoliae]